MKRLNQALGGKFSFDQFVLLIEALKVLLLFMSVFVVMHQIVFKMVAII